MITGIIRKKCSGSALLIVAGLIGLALGIYLISSGVTNTRKQRSSAYTLIVLSIPCMIAGIVGLVIWFAKLNRLREAEPWLSDDTLMKCETDVDGKYFIFSDRMIDMNDPKVIYYYNIDGLNIKHSYGSKGRIYFILLISLRTGGNVRITFRHRGFLTQEQTRAKVQMLYDALRQRCPYVV